MTYKLTAAKAQDRSAGVCATFSYEENILFLGMYAPHDEWVVQSRQTIKQRGARQRRVRDTIIKFLKDKYRVKGLKNLGNSSNDDSFFVANSLSKQYRHYAAHSNGTSYIVEVDGKLKQDEHLDDMLDCDALDARLSLIFKGGAK
jgi:hypothetical protein